MVGLIIRRLIILASLLVVAPLVIAALVVAALVVAFLVGRSLAIGISRLLRSHIIGVVTVAIRLIVASALARGILP